MYRIIIADDELVIRNTIKMMIHWEELDAVLTAEAEDGDELISLIRQNDPDIVISDIRMPGLSGSELINELGVCITHGKLIIVTGFGDFEYMREAIRSKAADYLLKPISEKELNDVIFMAIKNIQAEKEPEFQGIEESDQEEDTLKDIKRYLDEHYNEKITLEYLADQFFWSKEYISKRFKEKYGINLSDYLRNVRIQKGKYLLTHTDMQNSRIAQTVGFNDESHFCKVFKQVTGETPKEYKKRHR